MEFDVRKQYPCIELILFRLRSSSDLIDEEKHSPQIDTILNMKNLI